MLTNVNWKKNELKERLKIIVIIVMIIGSLSAFWLWYRFDTFSIILGVSIIIYFIMYFYLLNKKTPKWVGISINGLYFTDKKDGKIKHREIDEGFLNNIAERKAKVNNLILWSDIDGFKVEKPNKIFSRNCWIYLRNGVRVPINDLSYDIIKEIKAMWEEILDEER